MANIKVSKTSGAGVNKRGHKPGRAGRVLAAPSSAARLPKGTAAGRGSACGAMAGQCPAPAVKAVFSAGLADVVGGVSNTPHSNPPSSSLNNVVIKPLGFVNTCVDYLKVRFDGAFEPNAPRWQRLFRVLRVSPSAFFARNGASGYLHGFDVDEGLSWFWGGAFTASAVGEETSLMELKGSGCRAFEARVLSEHPGENVASCDWEILKAWDALLSEVFALGGHCTRVDLPTDDFSSLVPFDGLQERLAKRLYVSSLRKFSEFPEFPRDVDAVSVFKSRGGGYTATLGSRESIQLCIYNKKAEREAAGVDVIVPSWIRYECRFYHDCAVSALAAFYASFGCSKGLEENARREFADCRLSKDDLEGKVRELVFQGLSERDAWVAACQARYSPEEVDAKVSERVSSEMAACFVEGKGPAGFIFSLLKGLFMPLEKEVDEAHRCRGAVWRPWLDFVSGYSSLRVFAGVKAEETMVSNALWLDHDTSKALGRVLAADPSKSMDIARFLFNSGVSRMDERDLHIVNMARRARGLPPYSSVCEMVSDVCCSAVRGIDILADVDSSVSRLFAKGEARNGSARYDSDSLSGLSKKGGGE